MTKRLVIAAVLLVSAFVFSFLSVSFVVNEIEKTVAVIEESDDVKAAAEEILSVWQGNKTAFSLFLKHTDADAVDRYYIELETALRAGNEDEIRHILMLLKAYLSVTAEGEKIKSENIF